MTSHITFFLFIKRWLFNLALYFVISRLEGLCDMVINLNGLKKAGELLVFGAIAGLLFAGCSGSGGGDTAAAPTALLTVTPGKGLMTGATVVIKDANGNTLGNATTSAAGVAAVSIPASATGPFIVSVICPSSCQYFDEKSMSLKNPCR